jgi:hypothetical protein
MTGYETLGLAGGLFLACLMFYAVYRITKQPKPQHK